MCCGLTHFNAVLFVLQSCGALSLNQVIKVYLLCVMLDINLHSCGTGIHCIIHHIHIVL